MAVATGANTKSSHNYMTEACNGSCQLSSSKLPVGLSTDASSFAINSPSGFLAVSLTFRSFGGGRLRCFSMLCAVSISPPRFQQRGVGLGVRWSDYRYIHKVLSADVMVSGYVVWFAYFCISIELNPSKTLLYLRLRLWKRNESNANHITAWSLGTRSIL